MARNRSGDKFFSVVAGLGTWALARDAGASGTRRDDRGILRKFDAERLLGALQHGRFNNISAAATHYRMMRTSGAAAKYQYVIDKVSFTGEPIDGETETVKATFGHAVCSMYGTTEIGVILVNYPGARRFRRQAWLAG